VCSNCGKLHAGSCPYDEHMRLLSGREHPDLGPPSPEKEVRKCHRCGKPGHFAKQCNSAQGGGNRGTWKAKQIGASVRDEDAKVRGAIDAAKEISADVPELEGRIKELEAELTGKEERDIKKAKETEEQELQTRRDRIDVAGFHVKWRETNGDSPLTLGRLAVGGIAAAIAGSSFAYLSEVWSVTRRLIDYPIMLLATPLLSSNITGMSWGKSIFTGCIYGAVTAGLMVGADYYYSGFYGLRTCFAGGVFTDRRKKPIVREVKFLRWGPPCGKDRRPDFAKPVDGEHDPLLAVVEYTTTQAWKVTKKTKMVSMEILAQIAHHANMTHMVSDEISAVKLDMAAGKIATVKYSRYSAHLTTENIVSETARLAHAVRMAQLYRLERDMLPFYRPSNH